MSTTSTTISGHMTESTRLIAECRATLLRMLDTFAQAQGYNSAEWRAGLTSGAGECFDELVGLKDRHGFEQARGLTASRISLVHEEDLDFTLELTDLARRLREHCEAELSRLHIRFTILLNQRNTTIEQTPVGPETVCRALRSMADAAGFDHDERQQLVERAGPPLAHMLLELCRALNQRLEAAGIQAKTASRPAPPPSHIDNSANTVDDVHGAITSLERVYSHHNDAAPAPATEVIERSAMGNLQIALMHKRTLQQGNREAARTTLADPKLSASIVAQIEAWLAEKQIAGEDETLPSLGDSELAPLLPIGTALAVDTIEQIFHEIAEHTDLPTSIKRAIARLQTPMLRMALRDEQLLADPAHPAHRLIDTMATLGLTVPSYQPDHRVCIGLNVLAQRLVHKPHLDRQDFADAQAEVESTLEQRRKTAARNAQSALDLAAKAERREVAHLFASRALGVLITDDTPPAIRDFLETRWIRVLVRTLYKHGEKHPSWRDQLDIANQLTLSGQAGPDGKMAPEQRQRLPQLIARINEGLNSIGMDAAARQHALAGCMALHSALIVGRTPPPPPASRSHHPLALASAREQPKLRMLHHAEHVPHQPNTLPVLDLPIGTWLELELPDNSRLNGCITWQGPARKVALVCDPDDDYLLVVTLRALAELTQQQRCRAKRSGSLVEHAAALAVRALHG